MRLHGIWGLAQLAHTKPEAAKTLMPLAMDRDAEVRAQWAKFVGETRLASESDVLLKLLGDTEPRVRFQALLTLPKLVPADPKSHALMKNAIVAFPSAKPTEDPFVRHAYAFALV